MMIMMMGCKQMQGVMGFVTCTHLTSVEKLAHDIVHDFGSSSLTVLCVLKVSRGHTLSLLRLMPSLILLLCRAVISFLQISLSLSSA